LDIGRIITDSFQTMRRTGALWKLGTISAIQTLLYGLLFGGLVAPMAVLTQATVVAQQQAAQGGASGDSSQLQLASEVTAAVQWLAAYWPPVVFGIVTLVAIWAVFGVLDVAATAGVIAQTDVSAEGGLASASAGMREGLGIWWKTVSLLAVAALPSLIFLGVMAAVFFATISLPLFEGRLPDANAIAANNSLLAPLSTVVSIMGIPLGVWVSLGLRYAVIDRCDWKQALAKAWELVRARFVDVLVMYLIVAGVLVGIAMAMAALVALVVVVAVVGAATLSAGTGNVTGPVVVSSIAALAVALVSALALTVALVWQSVVWTLFWRQLTGRDQMAFVPVSCDRHAVAPLTMSTERGPR
jgi:hypothetical protein